MRTTQTTKAAFQTWPNGGGLQMSGFYTGKAAVEFEKSHFQSGTFATLYAFDSVEEGELEFERICKQVEDEEAAWLPY